MVAVRSTCPGRGRFSTRSPEVRVDSTETQWSVNVRPCHSGSVSSTYDALIQEGARADVSGWDFSWLDGRAEEGRPTWGYQRLVHERLATVDRHLDLQTGGGEVLAGAAPLPRRSVATEAWAPNRPIARDVLAGVGGLVVGAAEDALPFADHSFELVTARHPVQTPWHEVARVLEPGGTFLSQQVGPDSVRALSEWFVGPWPPGEQGRSPEALRRGAEAAGLIVTRIRLERLPIRIYDVGAVGYLLRKCPWWVPDFSIEAHADRLRAMHEHIERHGAFTDESSRVLLEAVALT